MMNEMEKETFIENFKKYNELLELQKSFEEGIIEEKDLSEGQRKELIKLYKGQIEELQINIDSHNRKLQIYKEKIINIRNKINN